MVIHSENALVLFARTSSPGKVKTRLMPVFTAEEACQIHAALLGDVLERASRTLSATTTISLAWSEPPDPSCLPVPSMPEGVPEHLQSGGDLGERMAMEFQARLREGHRKVVILGSDAPTLPGDHLISAFEALEKSEVVLGPTEDGGYYLLGMSHLHLGIFRNIQWGSDQVLSTTRQRLRKAGISFAELGAWHDVDTPEDVGRTWKEILKMKDRHREEIPQRTYALLARLVPGRIPMG
jgi:rSAM/selenodomain-associated transferase 1